MATKCTGRRRSRACREHRAVRWLDAFMVVRPRVRRSGSPREVWFDPTLASTAGNSLFPFTLRSPVLPSAPHDQSLGQGILK